MEYALTVLDGLRQNLCGFGASETRSAKDSSAAEATNSVVISVIETPSWGEK